MAATSPESTAILPMRGMACVFGPRPKRQKQVSASDVTPSATKAHGGCGWHPPARWIEAGTRASGTGWTASACGLEKFQAGAFGIASEGLCSGGVGRRAAGRPPQATRRRRLLRRRRRFFGRSGGVGATPSLASAFSHLVYDVALDRSLSRSFDRCLQSLGCPPGPARSRRKPRGMRLVFRSSRIRAGRLFLARGPGRGAACWLEPVPAPVPRSGRALSLPPLSAGYDPTVPLPARRVHARTVLHEPVVLRPHHRAYTPGSSRSTRGAAT